MEKKILRTFRFLNSLFSGFGEARFIYDEPPKDAELPKPEAERRPPEVEEKAEAEEAVKRTSGNEQEKFKTGVEAGRKLAELRRAEKLPDPNEAGKGAPANAGQTKRRPEEAEAGRPKLGLEKKAVAPLPVKPAIPIEEFLKRDLVKQHSELDRWSINIKRDQTKYNADTWDHSTIDGLKRIYQECNDLGIFDENQGGEYYETVFAVLRSAAHDDNPYRSDNDGAYVPMFANPVEGTPRQTISGLQPKGVPGEDGYFPGGEAFIRAYDSLVFLKAKVLIRQDKAQLSTADALRKMDEDPIGTTVVDFGKRNIAVIQQAMKERDYATLAVYGVGAYALWQTLGKKLWGDDAGHGDAGHVHKGFDFKKWVMIGAAVYGADKMLKNAGYDVMKMAGFKDMNAEVKGTPLESMQNILNQHNYEEYKDFDYGIALRMNGRSLVSLQELLLNANKSGIHIIQPNLFPNEFPDLRGFTANNDEKGINENKHSAGQRECNRVGKQLYLLAKAMGIVYDNTLHTHHKRFKSMSYDEALKNSVLQNSNILYMLEAAGQFAPPRAPGGLFSVRKLQEEEDKLREGTGKVLGNNGFDLVEELHPGSGHFSGFLKGFPVVVIVANDGYQVFLRNRYGKNYNAVPGDADATIPLEGPAMERGAQDAVKKVDERMKELVKKLQDGNKSIKDAKYENGKWVAITEFKGAADLGVEKDDVPTVINIAEYGERLTLSDGETSSDKYLERNVLGRLVDQPDFKLLSHFAAAGTLSMRDYKPGSAGTLPTFKLRIGKKGIETTIKYDKATKVFSFEPATQERDLLKAGSGFSVELREALGKNAEMSRVFNELKKMLEETDEDYLYNFFTKVPNWFTRATLDKPVRGFKWDQVSGSVAKNYTIALMETQKEFLMSKVANSVDGLTTLQDAEVKTDIIMADALRDWNAQLMNFSNLNTKNDNDGAEFSEHSFTEGVLRGLQDVGIKSNEYKRWSRKFTDNIFAKTGKSWHEHATKGRDIMKIFAYYTAPLDDPEIDGVDLRFTLTPAEDARVKIIQEVERTTGLKAGVSAADDAKILADAASLGAIGGGVFGFVNQDLELTRKQNKKEKFENYANYADYVVERIYLKINLEKGGFKDSDVPGPGAWGIEEFKVWEKTKIMPSKPEFVDREPALRMSGNYIPLNEYLLMTVAEKDQILASRRGDIMLPREDVDLKWYIASNSNAHPRDEEIIFEVFGVRDKNEFNKLFGVCKVDDPKTGKKKGERMYTPLELSNKLKKADKMPDLERAFFDQFQSAIQHLEDEYRGKINAPKFTELRNTYSLNYAYGPGGASADAEFHHMDFQYQSNSFISAEVSNLESGWIAAGGRITKTEQMNAIKQRVESIIKGSVLHVDHFRTYFNDPSIKDSLVNMTKEFWAWLWH